jgi:hypothetical protein
MRRALTVAGIAGAWVMLMGMDGQDLGAVAGIMQTAVAGLSAWAGSRSGVRELRAMLEAHLLDASAHRRGP